MYPVSEDDHMSLRIRTIVVDDEPIARRGLRKLLEKEPEIECIAECGSGVAAVVKIRELQPDLVFLDVEMPRLDGFGCLRMLDGDRLPIIVFVTAFDDYAVRAFEVEALDYILKPFTDRRLREVLRRVKEKIRRDDYASLGERIGAVLKSFPKLGVGAGSPNASPQSGLAIRTRDRTLVVPTPEIDWISSDDYYARLHLGGKSLLSRESMQNLERDLARHGFLRIHRSTIVNVSRIHEVLSEPNGRRTVVLRSGERLPVARRRRRSLEAALARRM